MKNTDYADYLSLFVNTPAKADSLLHCLGKTAGSTGLNMNAFKTENMSFRQKVTVSILSGNPQTLVNQYTIFGCNISSTEIEVNICQAEA